MNNQVQFAYLCCCVPPDFAVQINNFFSFSVDTGRKLNVQEKRKEIFKDTICLFYPKDIQKLFWK